MRSEDEMLALILDTARQDERVRAVMLNGSRLNPSAPRDFFQDYDVVYFVTGLDSFRADPHWIDHFGPRMILQLPDEMGDPPPGPHPGYAYLMQFSDGNRLDLTLFPVDKLPELQADSLSLLLLDKDGLFGELPPASESGYLPEPPASRAFADCCNEFWWVCPYVAKGLWRGEITYAKYMLDQVCREQLMKMLVWYIGLRTAFQVNPGKYGRYFERYIEPQLWEQLLMTYSDSSIEHTWESLFAMCDLFRLSAQTVASHLAFEYPAGEDQRVSAHLRHVMGLPADAREMY